MVEEKGQGTGADNRVHPRVDFFRKVKVTIPDESTAVDVFAGNVSQGGMFLRSNRPLPRGKKVALEFEVEDGKVEVEEGEVVWTKPFEPISIDGAPAGMGIRFTRMADASRQRIATFIEEELHDAPRSVPPASPEPAPVPPPSAPIEVAARPDDEKSKPPVPQPARARLPLSPKKGPTQQTPDLGATPAASGPTKVQPRQQPGGEAQGEPLMVSDPPPARSRALLFGIFVLFVAVVTFITLYFIRPFDQTPARDEQPTTSPPDEARPAQDEPTAQVKPAAQDTQAAQDKPPPEATPAAEDTPAEQTDEQPAESGKEQPATSEQEQAAGGQPGVGPPAFSRIGNGWRVKLQASARVDIKHFTLKSPPRLVVDFKQAAYTGQGHTLEADPPFIRQIRVGEQPDFTRYVFDFEGTAIPKHLIHKQSKGITVVFTP